MITQSGWFFEIFVSFSEYLNFRLIIYCAVYVLLFVAHQMSIFEIIVSSDVINVVPKCMYAQYRSYLFENLKCFKIEANVSRNISSIRISCRTVLLAVKKICCVKKACKKVLLPEEIV